MVYLVFDNFEPTLAIFLRIEQIFIVLLNGPKLKKSNHLVKLATTIVQT